MSSLIKRNMKKENGFTLIELLAVILILGIIALIAIPTVNGVIEQSRKGAAETSASQYIKSFEEKTITLELNNVTLSDGDYTVEDIEDLGLDLSGTKPEEGYLHISDNNVDDCSLRYGNYVVSCDGDDVTSSKIDASSWEIAENSTYIAKVYYNPTTGSKCTVDEFNANLASYENSYKDSNGNKAQNGLKDGCMVWYAYKDNGDGTVNLILNHNTSFYLTKGSSASSYKDVTDTLESDTSDWKVTVDLFDLNDLIEKLDLTNRTGFSLDNQYFLDSNGYKTTMFAIKDVDLESDNDYRFFWLGENLYDLLEGKYTKIYDNNEYDSYKIVRGFWTKNEANVNDVYTGTSEKYLWTVGEAYDYYEYNGKSAIETIHSVDLIGAEAISSNKIVYVGIRPVITLSYDVFK